MIGNIARNTPVRFVDEHGLAQGALLQGLQSRGAYWVGDVAVEDPDPFHRLRSGIPYSANGEALSWDWIGLMRPRAEEPAARDAAIEAECSN